MITAGLEPATQGHERKVICLSKGAREFRSSLVCSFLMCVVIDVELDGKGTIAVSVKTTEVSFEGSFGATGENTSRTDTGDSSTSTVAGESDSSEDTDTTIDDFATSTVPV